jgi:protein-tyrosine kinase
MSKIREALAKAKLNRPREEVTVEPQVLGRFAARRPAGAVDPADAHDFAGEGEAAAVAAPAADRYVEVDHEALLEAGLLAPENQALRLADEYRQVKRPLLANARGRNGVQTPRGTLIMVTSAVPNEGKTFTCINLSLSISKEKDWRVLLVDGDVAKRHVSRVFGLEDQPGLLDILRTPRLSAEDCVVPTDVAGLYLLPAGQPDEHAAELLASARMERVAEQLAERDPRRIVLFDSPPLLVTSEAPVLATHVGQIVVVVKAAHTTHQQVQHAVGKLDPDKAISLVLNQAEFGDESLSHGGHYGYGRYGYYGYGAQSSSASGAAPNAPAQNAQNTQNTQNAQNTRNG